MLSLLVLLNNIAQTYMQSLKKDLAMTGRESVLLIASISLIGLLGLPLLLIFDRFQLPTDPFFYALWFALTVLSVIQFLLFMNGLKQARFFAANAFSHLKFAVTITYAFLFLRESVTKFQWAGVFMALAGAMLLLRWEHSIKNGFAKNQGLFLIIFSLFISPLSLIFYKAAVTHTSSYNQFLTGRLLMDAIYYLIFWVAIFLFYYGKNPLPHMYSFMSSKLGITFMAGSALLNLADSWLIYKLSVVSLTLLGTMSIVASYIIARLKYNEQISRWSLLGGLLIIVAIAFFAV